MTNKNGKSHSYQPFYYVIINVVVELFDIIAIKTRLF